MCSKSLAKLVPDSAFHQQHPNVRMIGGILTKSMTMAYKKTDFIPLKSDSGQVIANLEAAYGQWHQAR